MDGGRLKTQRRVDSNFVWDLESPSFFERHALGILAVSLVMAFGCLVMAILMRR